LALTGKKKGIRFQETLEFIKSDDVNSSINPLIKLVKETGIHGDGNVTEKVEELTTILQDQPELAESLRSYLVAVFSDYDALTLFTDAGILPGHGFFSETYRRLEYKLLPPLQNAAFAPYLIRKVFYGKSDYRNIVAIDEAVWMKLLHVININPDVLQWEEKQLNTLLNALMVLSQRITSIGLEPDIVDKLTEIDDLQSPFFGLYREVQHYVDSFKADDSYIKTNDLDYQQILVMCTQCMDSIAQLHKHKEKYGISIHLAYLMVRLEQHVKRFQNILKMIQSGERVEFNKALFVFMCRVVDAENKKYSIRKHLNDNLSLIAYKITEHTSRVGEHYRAADRKEYYVMLKSAMGGGFVVAVMVILKIFAHPLHLSPFGDAFINSMLYAGGFICIHFLHFTLATKQPAMTANTIAASLDDTDKPDKKMLKTVKLISEISRAQFISLVGNMIIVFPAAYIIGWCYLLLSGHNAVSSDEAHHMIMQLHPWKTATLFYAAIAGVLLMSSGVIAGYYDNKVVYGRIPERIRQHPFLKRFISPRKLKSISTYLGNNSGLLLGNFFLGIFLGTTPLLGRFFGLPIDVRHVTLSAGNFGLALQGSTELPAMLIIEIVFSILLMGVINLFVSFGLAIYVAVRSRSLNLSLRRRILTAIVNYFRLNPSVFFIPPGGEKKNDVV
jgi:site-specific recombinase